MGIFSSSSAGAGDQASRRGDTTALSIVAAGTVIVGDIETSGTVKIEGHIRGCVRASGQILLAHGGMVEGDIYTREAILGGDVQGTIRSEERTEIQSTAVIHGDIITPRILIAEGGQINGTVSMGRDGGEVPDSSAGRLSVNQAVAHPA